MGSTPSTKPRSEPFTAGRLGKSTSPLLQEYVDTPALEVEMQHLSSVFQVDCAHLIMLATQDLISENQAGSIIQELESLNKDSQPQFTGKPGYGTMNLQIEEYLSQRLGQDTAGRLPIGRSRIDHGATVRRVSDRRQILQVQKGILDLQDALMTRANEHRDTVIISFTHMQQAQPATFGHYLLAFCSRIADSFEQLTQIYDRVNRSPLGAVGLSGTDLPIDRGLTAALLGFPKLVDNCLTGRDAYYQIEIASALALVMTIINDLCTDLHIQSAIEFGYIELDDSHCSTSSIFPQKKNPVALEAVELKAADSHGWAAAALATFRNEGTGDQYYRCLTYLKSACNTTSNMLHLTAEIVRGLKIHKNRCEEQLSKAWVTTSRVGNLLLLKHGVDYRRAHGAVGRLVRICIERGIAPGEVDVNLLLEAAAEMGVRDISPSDDDVRSALSYRDFVRESNSVGGVGPREFSRLLEGAKKQQLENKSWVASKENDLVVAMTKMERAAKALKETVGSIKNGTAA